MRDKQNIFKYFIFTEYVTPMANNPTKYFSVINFLKIWNSSRDEHQIQKTNIFENINLQLNSM